MGQVRAHGGCCRCALTYIMHVFWVFQPSGCLKGKEASAGYNADAKYIGRHSPDAESGLKRKQQLGPIVEDEGCRAIFGRLLRPCEETCKEVLGEEHRQSGRTGGYALCEGEWRRR